ncbi:MAG: hypothetical protein JXB25_03400, partial [Deltaproteobacteria bacterium]|nr:hypothetical protein [Deltaproteobacteria bacterium]
MKNITEPAPPLPLLPPETRLILIDAGMERLRLRFCDATRKVLAKATLPGRPDLQAAAAAWGLGNGAERPELLITGRLRDTVRELLGYGDPILPEAALWSAAAALAKDHPLAVLEVSASGYTAVGVNSSGELHGELLAAPPRCGSGTGINLDRVLQKLGVSRTEVDPLLAEFLGKAGAEHRRAIPLRSDRCGVFASSATVSDKNQGLPVADALAATLKSEVVKACKTIPEGFKTVWLTGGVFAWKFARDCARDYLNGQGVGEIPWDEAGELPLQGLLWLRDRIPPGRLFRPEPALLPPLELGGRPALAAVHRDLAERHLYHRLEPETFPASASIPAGRPLLIGLDVGSTMAKLVVADLNGVPLHCAAHSNAGDTLDTVKALFGELARRGAETLEVAGIGITGSARHQVRQALLHVYPELADRVLVLVENYAHARGSLDLARAHIGRLKEWGIEGIDEEFAIVIDVGGEDTKVSTVLLDEGELFDNVMNGKCSAGTGSLLDAQALHFGLPDCGAGAELAWQAQQGHSLNATCAVFLLESARRLEALGVPRGEILASAEWAVAENMARGLWSRLELPVRAVALLHGQTMLSEALPTAVAARLQEYLGAPAYCLVPPYPGHRACLGLIRTLAEQRLGSSVALPLCRFLDQTYDKRLFQCSGNACGNPEARCRRSRLSAVNPQGKKTELLLGGCAAINERAGRSGATRPDTWRELWEFSAAKLPRSEDPQRLVIPRQFAISEWAPFFAHLFLPLGIPVHVDAIAEQDIIAGRPHFPVDACAPFLGAVGQLLRLAGEPHGTILAPQIEFLPGPGSSLGRACTVNQGGPATAVALARQRHPEARFHLFHL